MAASGGDGTGAAGLIPDDGTAAKRDGETDDDGGGCSCRALGTGYDPPRSPFPLLFAALVLGAASLRRKRRRKELDQK